MTIHKRTWWLFSMLAYLFSASGCATSNLQPIHAEINREGAHLNDESGQRINGYLLLDGAKIEYKGWAKIAGEDSIMFWRSEAVGNPNDGDGVTMVDVPGPVYALGSVVALDIVSENSWVGAALFGVIVLGGLIVAIAVSVAANPPNFQ